MKKIAGFIIGVLLGSPLHAQVPDKAKVIAGAERAFDKAAKSATMPAPGCAVGVSINGESVFEKAFGLAEMEHSITNTTQTIFESGSVAKQFTAAALVLLEQEGKLRLDDPVRKYIPELPDYGAPLTIRHLLHHTAGLRDWGSVAALTGAGRGDRMFSQALAIDIVLRQSHLDFKPGAEYSYSNSGYQLAAEIVERVSKQKFTVFTDERLFKPLGMTKTSWRDDYQRLVLGRAQAYSRLGTGPWRLNMPLMSVYGNGGMLTTVGDWLKWNAMLDARTWNAALVDTLETQGVLNDGRKISYALGLSVDRYKGMKSVSHGGSTGGYQTFLARYPEKKLSVAVLCNGTSPNPRALAESVTDEILAPFPEGPKPPEGTKLPEEQLKKYAGLWKNDVTRYVNLIAIDQAELKIGNAVLKAQPDGSFVFGTAKLIFGDGSPATALITNPDGSVSRLTQVSEWKPVASELSEFIGDWHSEEAQATFTFVVEGDKAFIVQHPTTRLPLTPTYRDHFSTQELVVWVTRGKAGKINQLHVAASRMRDMSFERRRK